MKTFKFKTNLKCNNCVAKVREQLDTTSEIQSWTVDLKSPERIMTVETDDEEVAGKVKKILTDAGYLAEICPG